MRYPIFIEDGNETTAFGIHIPDIPNAVTAGDTFDEAYQAGIEVAHIMLSDIAQQGLDLPLPTSVEHHKNNPDYAGMGWGYIDIDVTPYLGKTEKVNVTLPSYLVTKIDHFVQVHNIKSRSAFLAEVALEKINRA
ncbi:type II toxin-antitoxin system HicB family antitoxin [Pseudomonas sp. F1_0610]|uniref:type II toxin-antitoxin system HicB family antitoxin n=1 Tax=Pseudomonas sp. F1_0610 TaxID=3114284 RepID=UPI0039C032F1